MAFAATRTQGPGVPRGWVGILGEMEVGGGSRRGGVAAGRGGGWGRLQAAAKFANISSLQMS